MRTVPLIVGVLFSTLAWPIGAAAETPSYTIEERASAIAGPALVFIDVRFEGVMRNKETSVTVDAPVVVHSRCSGFVVNAAGYVVTSTHCVRPNADTMRSTAAVMATNTLIREKKLASEQKDAYIKELLTSSEFTDRDSAAAPAPKIAGQLFTASAKADITMAGKLVAAEHPVGGSVALLRFPENNLPVVDLEAATLSAGAGVTQLGYGTHDSNLDTAAFLTRLKVSKIVGKQGEKEASFSKMDSELGSFSHGGIVVNDSGQAVGMINVNPATKERTNNLITETALIEALLSTLGVTNSLAPTDITYRSALDAYFGGRYPEAIRKFDDVLAAVPAHEQAAAYRKKAEERQSVEGKQSSGMPQWLIIALSSLGGALLVGLLMMMVILRLRRRSRRTVISPFAPKEVQIVGPARPGPDTGDEPFTWPKVDPSDDSRWAGADSPWATPPAKREESAGDD